MQLGSGVQVKGRLCNLWCAVLTVIIICEALGRAHRNALLRYAYILILDSLGKDKYLYHLSAFNMYYVRAFLCAN